MGWRFQLKDANIVAFLTIGRRQPPRVTKWQLREFLNSFEDRQRPPLLSSDPRWIQEIATAAHEAKRALDNVTAKDGGLAYLSPDVTMRVLFRLQFLLGHFDVCALPVGRDEHAEMLNSFAQHGAYTSRHHAIFLMPNEYPSSHETVSFLDPFPSVRPVLEHPETWPGILFWIRSGASAFIPFKEAEQVFTQLLHVLDEFGFPRGYEALETILREYSRPAERPRTLLHLSDLHFGRREAIENEAYLSAHLESFAGSVDRIIVTGDLFDNPKREDASAFRNFRARLERATGKQLIVIPGNHDQKVLGNSWWRIGRKLDQVANLEWSNLMTDDQLECNFLCFDSSKDADLARGRITNVQLMNVATEFETRAAQKSELRRYLSVALVHHHPFSFESRTETFVQRALSWVGLNDERFLRMEDADAFLSWCAGRKIPLILHGHKHVPRHVTKSIKWSRGTEGDWRDVTSVGCGTSLGAEKYPLSYNIVRWSPKHSRWSVAFFSDPGDGSGFEEDYIALHTVRDVEQNTTP